MKRQFTGLALALTLLGAGQVQALVIDDFNSVNPGACGALVPVNQAGQCVGSPADVPNYAATNLDTGLSSSVVGGSRDLSIMRTAGAGTAVAGVNIGTDPGALNYANPSNTTSTLTMVWDGDATQGNFGAGLGGGAGVDLTLNHLPSGFPSGPATHLNWHITSLDLNLLTVVYLKDADGTIAGNAFLKLPADDGTGVCDNIPVNPNFNPLVCVQPSLPGNLYHGLALFNTGGTDPARPTLNFFDDPLDGNPTDNDGSLAPMGGGVLGLDLTKIVAIRVIFDTSGNAASDTLDVRETCFSTTPLLGNTVPPGPDNGIGRNDHCSTVVPEPGTILLMGTGLLSVALVSLRSRRRQSRRQV